MSDTLDWLTGQGNPAVMLAIGAAAVFVAMALVRLIRRVRRLIWSASLLLAAGGMGAGGGWTFIDALNRWH